MSAFGPGGDAQLAVPRRLVVRELGPDQVALLGEDRAVRLLLQLALVRLDTGCLREQEAVVGGDDDVVAVQVVDDVPDQRRQFVDGPPHGLEGIALRSCRRRRPHRRCCGRCRRPAYP